MGKCFSVPKYHMVAGNEIDIEIIETRLNTLESRVNDISTKVMTLVDPALHNVTNSIPGRYNPIIT